MATNTGVRILHYRGTIRAQVWDPRKTTSTGKLGAYRTRSGFATKGAARLWVTEQQAEIANGLGAERRNERHTVGDEIDRWLALSAEGANTAQTHRVRATHLARVSVGFRAIPVRDLTVSDVQAWQASLGKATSERPAYHPRTVKQTVGQLATVLESAVRDRRMAWNPAKLTDRVAMPKRVEAEHLVMAVEVVEAIRAAMPERYRVAVDLMFGAGLRAGEMLGAKLTDVRGIGRGHTLRVERQWTPLATGHGFADPKHGSKRTVPLVPTLVDRINHHVATFGTGTLGTIVSLPNGRPMAHSQWSRMWSAAVATAGVAEAGWTPHDLRHAFGSLHYNAGTPATTVAAWMGHTVAVFQSVYAHRDERHEAPLVDPLASKVARELHGSEATNA